MFSSLDGFCLDGSRIAILNENEQNNFSLGKFGLTIHPMSLAVLASAGFSHQLMIGQRCSELPFRDIVHVLWLRYYTFDEDVEQSESVERTINVADFPGCSIHLCCFEKTNESLTQRYFLLNLSYQ